jgi:hypothetical protein
MRLGFKPANWELVFIRETTTKWVAHWQYVHPNDWNRPSDPRTGCQISLAVKPHRDDIEDAAVFCQDCIRVFAERALAEDDSGVS